MQYITFNFTYKLHIQHTLSTKVCFQSSVADPDPNPDPVGSGLFWSPGSGSGKIPDPDPLSTKRPHVIQIFSL